MEGSQTFLSLGYEVGVALEGAEAHRVVEVGDCNVVSAQLLAEKHILIAVIAEALVKRVDKHQVTADEEVGGVEVVVGILLAYLNRMLMLDSLLITIAEIVPERIGITAYTDTAINDFGALDGCVF